MSKRKLDGVGDDSFNNYLKAAPEPYKSRMAEVHDDIEVAKVITLSNFAEELITVELVMEISRRLNMRSRTRKSR